LIIRKGLNAADNSGIGPLKKWYAWQDSNLRPAD
jgi:hypothetical protein